MYCINQICAWKGTSASDCNLQFDRWKGEHCLRQSGIECPSSQNVSPSPASGSGSSGGSSGSESTSDKNTNPPSVLPENRCYEAYLPHFSHCSGYGGAGYTCVGDNCAAIDPSGNPASCAVLKPAGWILDKNTGKCVDPNVTSGGSGSNFDSGSESTSNCDTQCSQSELSKVSTCMEAVEKPPPPTSSSSDNSDSGGSSSCSYTSSEARACWNLVRYDSDNTNCDKPGAGGSLKSCWDRSSNWAFDCGEFTSCGVCCSSSRRLAASDDNLCKYYQELSACFVSCMCDDQECGSGSHFESLRNAMDDSLSGSSGSCPMKCGQKASLYSLSVVKTVSPLLNIMLCLLVLLSFYM